MTANWQNRKVITSFMLRFVQEADTLAGDVANSAVSSPVDYGKPENNFSPSWRGVVTHIQSGTEHHFTTLAEAEAFILKYLNEG